MKTAVGMPEFYLSRIGRMKSVRSISTEAAGVVKLLSTSRKGQMTLRLPFAMKCLTPQSRVDRPVLINREAIGLNEGAMTSPSQKSSPQ